MVSLPTIDQVGAGFAGVAVGYAAYNLGKAAYNGPLAPAYRGAYGGDFMFPLDLVNPGIGRNFYMAIQFKKYERRSIFDQPTAIPTGGIMPPVPNNLRDQLDADWAQDAQPVAGAGIEQLLKDKGKIRDAFSSGLADGLKSTADAVNAGVIGVGAQIAANTIGQGNAAAGLQLAGLSQNPFLTMLYKSPAFRSHQFDWTLAPRNYAESDALNNIINAFKSNMLPSLATGTNGILLNYPNMAEVAIFPQGYLYNFKMCVVKSLAVNFAPNGPSFFKTTHAPTEVSLSVTLQEIEYMLQEDIIDSGLRSASPSYPPSMPGGGQ